MLVAAGLKLYGQEVSAIPPIGRLSRPQVQMAAVVWELTLGAWLLSAQYASLAWLASLVTFLVFACVSGVLGSAGVARCGCFGMIEAGPWSAFALDTVILILLGVFRPVLDLGTAHSGRLGRKWLTGLGITAALGVLLVVTFVYEFGSLDALAAAVRGDVLVAQPAVIDLGAGVRGQRLTGRISIVNVSDCQVRLVGGTTDCACTTTADLPVTIPPRGTVEIEVRVMVNAESGVATQQAWIWTDSPKQPTLHVLMQYLVVSSDVSSRD